MKFYIHGNRNSPPSGFSTSTFLPEEDTHIIHEFDAANRTVAKGYFEGYRARWIEMHQPTTMHKHYICGPLEAPPTLLTDDFNTVKKEKGPLAVHTFEVPHWEFATYYFKGYVARWGEQR